MVRVVTSKVINLSQLDSELGSQGLSINDNDPQAVVIVTADESTISEAELEVAVAAHVAQPIIDPSAAIKASIGAKLSANPVQSLSLAEVAWLAKAIS
jgi:hypothetical protein